jgi:hypothetical protein
MLASSWRPTHLFHFFIRMGRAPNPGELAHVENKTFGRFIVILRDIFEYFSVLFGSPFCRS